MKFTTFVLIVLLFFVNDYCNWFSGDNSFIVCSTLIVVALVSTAINRLEEKIDDLKRELEEMKQKE